MTALRGFWRVAGSLCLLVGAIGSAASAGVTVDLVPGGDPAASRYVEIADPSAAVNFQLWVSVTGGDAETSNDGLWKFYAKIMSSNGGLVQGNIDTAPQPWGNAWHMYFGGAFPSPFGPGGAATLGDPADLDGDGDIDIGSNNVDDAVGWMLGRAGSMTAPNPMLDATVPPGTWRIANYVFNGTGPGPDANGVTRIFVLPREKNETLWNEDETDVSGQITPGQEIVLYMAAGAAAPPTVDAVEGEVVTLDASGSVGSINTYEWDLDGDGTYDFTTGDAVADFAHGLAAGTYNGQLRVSWVENPTLTEDVTGFTFEVVPEPATMALLGLGAVLTLVRRRK